MEVLGCFSYSCSQFPSIPKTLFFLLRNGGGGMKSTWESIIFLSDLCFFLLFFLFFVLYLFCDSLWKALAFPLEDWQQWYMIYYGFTYHLHLFWISCKTMDGKGIFYLILHFILIEFFIIYYILCRVSFNDCSFFNSQCFIRIFIDLNIFHSPRFTRFQGPNKIFL